MPLWLRVDPHNGVPIYIQLVDGIRKAIEMGHLSIGDALPTVRQLSSELRIAPNTISKAYMELQRQGWIETRAGAGSVVISSGGSSGQDRTQQTFLELEELVIRLYRMGIAGPDILRFVEGALEPLTQEAGKWR